MKWRLAKCLEQLRVELNGKFPNRSKVSDGSIGNAEHASRKSDHNPWIKDKKGVGVVSAIDVTFDDNPSDGVGVNCHELAKALQSSKDKRIKYIIWNRQITEKGDISKWKHYPGANSHEHHLHLSVKSDAEFYDDGSAWNLDFTAAPQVVESKLLKVGSKGDAVREIQNILVKKMYMREADGIFGAHTEAAVKDFQKDNGLTADGIVGEATRAKLKELVK